MSSSSWVVRHRSGFLLEADKNPPPPPVVVRQPIRSWSPKRVATPTGKAKLAGRAGWTQLNSNVADGSHGAAPIQKLQDTPEFGRHPHKVWSITGGSVLLEQVAVAPAAALPPQGEGHDASEQGDEGTNRPQSAATRAKEAAPTTAQSIPDKPLIKLFVGSEVAQNIQTAGAGVVAIQAEDHVAANVAELRARRPSSAVQSRPKSAVIFKERSKSFYGSDQAAAAAAEAGIRPAPLTLENRTSTFIAVSLMLREAKACGLMDAMDVIMVGDVSTPSAAIPFDVARHLNGEDGKSWNGVAAVIEPLRTKGRIACRKGDLFHIVRPFTDAEVFQLYYLQVVLRVHFNLVLLGMERVVGGDDDSDEDTVAAAAAGDIAGNVAHLLPHRLGVRQHSEGALVFCGTETVLRFPKNSQTVIPLHYTEVAHPTLPGAQELPAVQTLFGASPSLPCVSSIGQRARDWAASVKITSRDDARGALDQLFAQFAASHSWDGDVVGSGVAETYRCDAGAAVALRMRLPKLMNVPDSRPTSSAAPIPRPTSARPMSAKPTSSRPARAGQPISAAAAAAVADLVDDGPSKETEAPFGEELLQRWARYVSSADTTVFTEPNDHGFTGDAEKLQHLRCFEVLGSGGSGLVFRGTYRNGAPVAVKCFYAPDGLDPEGYLKESLADLAFGVVSNELRSSGVLRGCAVVDFLFTSQLPEGVSDEQAVALRRRQPEGTKFAILVTEIVDGTVGRFLAEGDEDYDPSFDEMRFNPDFGGGANGAFGDAEMFQLLYTQLVLRAVHGYVIHDLMLNERLRGDNLGFRTLAGPLVFQDPTDASVGVVFEASGSNKELVFIDVGQGLLDQVQLLSDRGLVGSTLLDSCTTDDGTGRFWPADQLIANHVAVRDGAGVAAAAKKWATELHLVRGDRNAAIAALGELFALYAAFRVPKDEVNAAGGSFSFACNTPVLEEALAKSVYQCDW